MFDIAREFQINRRICFTYVIKILHKILKGKLKLMAKSPLTCKDMEYGPFLVFDFILSKKRMLLLAYNFC